MMTTGEVHKFLLIFTANPRGDLPGCDADADRIAGCLPGFEVRWIRGATRRAVFEAFDEVLRELRPDSVLVVYISGHGGLARFHPTFGPGFPSDLEWPFFVTADQEQDGIFRSVLALELSELVGRCARVAANITVIIDTCYAQEQLRSRPRLKSVGAGAFAVPTHLVAEHAPFTTYAAWVASLRAKPRPASLLDDGVVCVAAAATGQPAYERTDSRGRPGGAFTIELCEHLADAMAHRVCWQQLISVVRERLAARGGFQRPVVTGPSGRRVFELDSVDVSGGTSLFRGADGAAWIRSGRLHGTRPGDRFTARGTLGFAQIHVAEVLDDRARVEVTGQPGALPAGSLAFPAGCTERLAVALEEDCPQRSALLERIASGTRVTACGAGERAALRLGRHTDGIEIRAADGQGVLISDATRVLADLEALARTCVFEELMEEAADARSPLSWRSRTFHVRGDQERELAEGDEVAEGDRLWVEITNSARAEVPGLHVNVVERGADGRLRVLNARQHPAGAQVRCGTTQRILWYPEGPHGRRQVWPHDAPRDAPRRVVWYLVASPVPLDLRSLAVDPVGVEPPRVIGHCDVLRATENVPALPGAPVGSSGEPRIRWDRRRLSFSLVPR